MTTATIAESFVKEYFRKSGHLLTKAKKGECGYDFYTADRRTLVEVKGTTKPSISVVPFRYFTNKEYEKARECIQANQTYEIHLVVDINNENRPFKHYVFPASELIDTGTAEVIWSLPIRKHHEKYLK